MSRQPGEVAAAIRSGYRVTVHKDSFPYTDARTSEVVHAEVDHAVQAVFCSEEFAKTHRETKVAT